MGRCRGGSDGDLFSPASVAYTLGSVTVPSLASVYNEFALKKHMDTRSAQLLPSCVWPGPAHVACIVADDCKCMRCYTGVGSAVLPTLRCPRDLAQHACKLRVSMFGWLLENIIGCAWHLDILLFSMVTFSAGVDTLSPVPRPVCTSRTSSCTSTARRSTCWACLA